MRIDRRKLKGWLYRYLTPVNVEYGDDFCYKLSTQTVIVSENLPDSIYFYLDFCKKRGLKKEVDPWVLCLLHEIGHDQTLLFINSVSCLFDSLLGKFAESDSYTMLGVRIKMFIYFRLPAEKAATDWAIDFINNNLDKVKELESYLYGRRKA